jgi:ubiquinone/menaquinone biosynthesis C-methylase UbiE
MQDNMPIVARFWNDIATDFDAIYTGKNKSAIAKAADRHFRKDIYQRFDWVMEKSGDVKNKTVCDIGCGSGRFVIELARRGSPRVTGVDVAPNMLKLASDLIAQNRVTDRCDLVEADVLNWKTSDKYDITIAIGFWDYIMDPPARLRNIRAITKQQFLSAWPRFWTWRMPVRKVRLEYINGCPVYFYKKQHIYEMMEKTGFRVESCETVGKLFCVDARPV